MKRAIYSLGSALPAAACIILFAVCCAQAQSEMDWDTASPVSETQSVSQTGLLPVYGADLEIDKSWVDGKSFPSQSAEHPNSGVSAAMQQVWDAVKSSGFNVVRFPLDVGASKESAVRLANLCIWAKANGVSLVPVLVSGGPAAPLPSNFGASAAALVKEAVRLLKSASGADIQTYMQIMAYQLGSDVNRYGADSSLQTVKQAASAVRSAETEALKDTGLSATPQVVSLSFDYELVKSGAAPGVALTDEKFDKAYESLRKYIQTSAGLTEADIISVSWLPGSLSAGGAEKLSALAERLKADAPAKQTVITTGFSTGFSPPASQVQNYAAAFSNLADYRARDGANSLFIGVFFRTAFDSADAAAQPPSADTVSNMAAWDWEAKASDIANAMRNGPGADEIGWWLRKSEGSLGMLNAADPAGAQGYTAKAAQEALAQIAASVSEANAEAAAQAASGASASAESSGDIWGTEATAVVSGASSGVSGVATSLATAIKSKFTEGLLGLLDKVFQKVGDKIAGAGSGASMGSSGGDIWGGSSAASTGGDAWGSTAAGSSTSSADPWAATETGGSPGTAADPWAATTTPGSDAASSAPSTGSGTPPASSGTSEADPWATTEAGTPSTGGDDWGETSPSLPSGGTAAGPVSVEVKTSDISVNPASPSVGQDATVTVTVRNKSAAAPAGGLTVALNDSEGVLAGWDSQVTDLSIPAGGSKSVSIPWTPDSPGMQNLRVDVYTAAGPPAVAGAAFSVTVKGGGGGSTGPSSSAASESGWDESDFEIPAAEVTIFPTVPKANQKVNVEVLLENKADSDEVTDVILVDESPGKNDAWLGETDGVSVGKKNSKRAKIEWTPTQPGTYRLGVMLFKGSDLITRASLSEVTVEAGEALAALGDVSIDPQNPAPKHPFKMTVEVQNSGTSEVKDLDLYVYDPSAAIGGSGTVPYLAAAKINKIEPGGTTSAVLNNIQLEASDEPYSLTVEVWPPDLTAPMPYDQKSVSVAVSGSAPGEGAPSSEEPGGVSESEGTPGPGTPSSGGATPGSPGGVGVSIGEGSSGTGEGSTGTGGGRPSASTIVGGKLLGVQASPVPVEARIPVGLPQVSQLMLSSSGSVPTAGQPCSLTFTVSNPYASSIPDVGVAVSINGKQVETRSLGTILPKQTRSVVLSGLKLDKAGQHGIEIALTGGAGGALKGSASAKVSVAPGVSRTQALSRPVAVADIKPPAPTVAPPRPSATRSVLPPVFSAAGKTVGVRPAAAGMPGTSVLVALPSAVARPSAIPAVSPLSSPGSRPPAGAAPAVKPTAVPTTAPPATTPAVRPTIGTVKPTAAPAAIPGVGAPATGTAPGPTAGGTRPVVTTPTTVVRPTVTPTVPSTGSPAVTPTAPTTATPTVKPAAIPGVAAPTTATRPTAVGTTPTAPAASTPTVTPTAIPGVTTRPAATTAPTAAAASPAPTTPTVTAPTTVLRPTATAATSPTAGTTAPATVSPTSTTPTVVAPTTVLKPTVGTTAATETASPTATAPTGTAPTLTTATRPTAGTTTTSTASTPTAATPTVVAPTTVLRPTAAVPVPSPTTTTATPTTPSPTTTATPTTAPTAVAPTAPVPGVTTATPTVTPTTTTVLSPVTAARVLTVKPDLALTMSDVRFSTLSPKAGDTISAAITVRSVSAVDVTGAKVAWLLVADGVKVGQGEIPVSVKANSSAQVAWKGVVPKAKQMALNLKAICADETNTSNNAATVTLNIAQ